MTLVLILLGLMLMFIWFPLGILCFIGAAAYAIAKSNRKHREVLEALKAAKIQE